MKGSPLLRALLVVLALLAVLWPLRSLTIRRADGPPTPAQAAAAPEANVHLVLASTSLPFTFAVSHLGQIIWKGEATEGSAAHDLRMAFPPEGIDLFVEVKWPGHQPAAVKLEVTPENGETMTRMLWGSGQASGVLTFTKP